MKNTNRLAAAIAGSVIAASPAYAATATDYLKDAKDDRALFFAAVQASAPRTLPNDLAHRMAQAELRPMLITFQADQYPGNSCVVSAEVISTGATLLKRPSGEKFLSYEAEERPARFDFSIVRGANVVGEDVILQTGNKETDSVAIDLGNVNAELMDVFGIDDIHNFRERVAKAAMTIANTCGDSGES